MAVGRFFCVGLPVVLTIASIIALLVATLSGVTHQSLPLFRVNVTDLSVSKADIGNIAGKLGLNLPARADGVLPDKITAASLGISQVYDVTLWGFCATNKAGERECTKAQFDWASHKLNSTWIEDLGSAAGVKVNLPNEVKEALNIFSTVSKWTQVAFIVALVALGVELVVGVFAGLSRVVSCLTWLVAGITALLVGAAATLATVTASVVVGAVDSTTKIYGVKGSVGGRFLAAAWVAFAFAVGAAFFWLFTICCCKPEHRSRSSRNGYHARKNIGHSDGEKLIPANEYAPLSNEHEMSGGGHFKANQPTQLAQPYGAEPPRYPGGNDRSDLAYEPYSHRA